MRFFARAFALVLLLGVCADHAGADGNPDASLYRPGAAYLPQPFRGFDVRVGPPARICEVDVSESPRMAAFARALPSLCESNYPKIKRKLVSDSFQPPGRVKLVFRENLSYPAQALGDQIELSSGWFTEHPDDLGAIVHEMAHVVQAYPPGQPSWVTEGIADYIRYWRGYQSATSYAHCAPGSDHYTSGYWCSAAFLKFVEKKYDGKIVARLNKALRENRYSDSLFNDYTGKSPEQLWQECRKKDCQGGRP
jgi:hypothetical protein